MRWRDCRNEYKKLPVQRHVPTSSITNRKRLILVVNVGRTELLLDCGRGAPAADCFGTVTGSWWNGTVIGLLELAMHAGGPTRLEIFWLSARARGRGPGSTVDGGGRGGALKKLLVTHHDDREIIFTRVRYMWQRRAHGSTCRERPRRADRDGAQTPKPATWRTREGKRQALPRYVYLLIKRAREVAIRTNHVDIGRSRRFGDGPCRGRK